ncbi:PaaI family thioesterase [Synoicihabitans lomoniglobus]|uniref:PaaI family thioesterase n=1 Tax=Synoicihabitans lomoniglobus TaxID=2909285 RepID=A0AAE9ZYU2_9BACT|nr:PaaI family thioesterase [Opitutaceae bacterium LMO-M01]WED63763.1 PaaI family thioesterase [Opitutaceae bacterium LMO-M01]
MAESLPNADDRFADAPISRLIGFQVAPERAGVTEVALEAEAKHANPMGRVHGGVIAALADAAMGTAYGRQLRPEEDFSTIELKVNFMRPVRLGRIVATARVVQRGLRIGFLDCEIHSAGGKLVATATCTCMTIAEV